MKKIIDGKMYNTETAESLASDSYSFSNDFNFWYEELYRTKKGKFFLYGEGGAMSKYSVNCGNNTTSGSQEIRLLSEMGARNWMEEHATAEEFEKVFEVDEG